MSAQNQMKELSRADILAVKDLPIVKVTVPDWGGFVYVRGMSGKQRDDFEIAMLDTSKSREMRLKNMRATLCSMCIVDAGGKPIFTKADVEELGNRSSRALEVVFDKIQELSRVRAGDLEASEKN